MICRLGFIYSDARPYTLPIAGFSSLGAQLLGNFKNFLPVQSLTVLPLNVELVADAICSGIENNITGILEVDDVIKVAKEI